jgi:hypothetical protein
VLVGQPVVLELDEELVASEDVLQATGQLEGASLIAGEQRLQHDAAEAPGRGDEPLVVDLEQLPVHPRLVVIPLEVGGRRELDEVAVAGGRLRKQGQVVVKLVTASVVAACVVHAATPDGPLEPRVRRHVGLGADDRRDPLLAALLVEVEDAVHVAVVGDGERRLTVGDGRGHDVPDSGSAVEHRVLGVGVQVGKRCPLRLVIHCLPPPVHSRYPRLWTSYTLVIRLSADDSAP